jgi:prevent-host-death family protein
MRLEVLYDCVNSASLRSQARWRCAAIESVSATEVKGKFLRLLRLAREGRTFVVALRGKPAAKVVPMAEEDEVKSAARAILLNRLRSQRVRNVGRWTRDELYER